MRRKGGSLKAPSPPDRETLHPILIKYQEMQKKAISSQQLVSGKKSLKKTPQKPKQAPASPLEQAFEQIQARRPSIVVEEGEDEAEPYWREPEEWEMEGSGLPPPPHREIDEMIEQLYVKLGSIRAGNTSLKLRKGVVSLLSRMVKAGVLNELQRRKILHDYIEG